MTSRPTRLAAVTAGAALLLLGGPQFAHAQEDVRDPAAWEAHWSEDGNFVNVDCTVDVTGYEFYVLDQDPPEGQRWFLVALLNDEKEDLRTEYGMPRQGEELVIKDETTGQTVPADVVVLCSADEGSRGFTETEGEPGPVVETDVPAPTGPSAAPLLLGAGALVLAAGAVAVGTRRRARG
jgi:hypothetical protein